MNDLNFEKYADGLIPAIVQDVGTGAVLMLGFMDREALEITRSSGRVTLYSRSRNRIWTKGETSGNFLDVITIEPDCDGDTLLVMAKPNGPVCHTGEGTCFSNGFDDPVGFLRELEGVIAARKESTPPTSYVASLYESGLKRIAQKVGEEAVETVIAAMEEDNENLKDEAADLLFHLMVLLQAKGLSLREVSERLRERHRS